MSVEVRGLDYYDSLNYKIEIERDEEGDYIASIPLLTGCLADAPTPEEAVSRILDAKREWIASRIQSGLTIPEPQSEFSGRFVIRVAPSLHRKIVLCASQEHVSMNQFVNTALAEAVGYRHLVVGPAAAQGVKVLMGPDLFVTCFNTSRIGGMFWRVAPGGATVTQNEPKVLDVPAPAELTV